VAPAGAGTPATPQPPESALIAGLRNPGSRYAGTRHNVGSEVVAVLAGRLGAGFKRAPGRIRAEIGTARLNGTRLTLVLPTTYMNESGAAVAPLLGYFGIEPTDLVVVHDDIDLAFGTLRFQYGRGSGGNRGIESVTAGVGSGSYWRLRFGVGRPPAGREPADFVLEPFGRAERAEVDILVQEAADLLEVYARRGGDAARQAAGGLGA
jgi:PTH1 family peptidyl-tRNA hydrolase